MNSALPPCGSRWLQIIARPTWIASTPMKLTSTARYLPQTYSAGRSGVECSSSPTRCSSSRITDMPAATETKKT